jgi:hypothetical protein
MIVSRFGTEFGLVEHQLRMQLGAPKCVISEMTKIQLKAFEAQFKGETRKMDHPNIVDVFLPVEQLGKSAKEIIKNGIDVDSTTGLKFNVSKVHLPSGQQEYKIIHAIVALGKVYSNITTRDALQKNDIYDTAPVNIATLPDGFNSLRVSENDDFVIFKAQQINPVHLLTVKGGDNVEYKDLQDFICDVCHKKQSAIYCINDKLKLCNDCDDKIHKANEITKTHDRKKLVDVIANFQECPEHPGNMVQYYCPQCNLPVCMECKVSGNHSHKDTMKHKLVPINKEYMDKGEEVQKPSLIRQQREKVLKQAIIEAEELQESLNRNLEKMIEEINRIASAAIEEAKTLTGERLIIVKSSLAELQRKYNQLKTQRDLVVKSYECGEPVPFLQTFTRNQMLDKDIESSIDLQKPNDVKSDLAVFGRIEIKGQKDREEVALKVVERDIKVGGLTNQADWTATETLATRQNRNEVTEQFAVSKPVKITTLDKMAERKARKYAEAGKELDFLPFEGSEIIKNPELARKLYLCFPFKAMPETHLMFSTSQDGRDIKQMHKLVDGKGISVIIIRSGEHIFGGFAASKWANDSRPFGEGTSSFLFSVDNNAFIPARPQSEDPIYLLGTPDTFSFGRDDLVIAENFDRCASTIENTFGIGLKYGSEQAQKFLAGAPRFRADDVEVWGFFSPQ